MKGSVDERTRLLTESRRINDEVLVSSDSEANALEGLYKYYIKESSCDPIPFDRAQKTVLFLQVVGATAGIYLWPPAREYAKGKAPWLGESVVVTNPLSGVLFLTKATGDFLYTIIRDFTRPQQLKSYMEPVDRSAIVAKYTKLAVGSAVCAIPFGILTYLFPIPSCDSSACIWSITVHSWVINVILHALSWGFIFTEKYWYYRLPSLPFEKLYRYYRHAKMSETERVEFSEQARLNEIFRKYKSIVAGSILNASQRHVQKHTQQPAYLNHEINTFEDFIKSENDSVIERSCLHHPYILNAWGLFGGLFIVVGLTGWVTSAFYLASHVFHWNVAATIAFGILPAYTTIVLGHFFGSHIMTNIYRYFTTFESCNSKIPVEAKMYPLIYTLMTVMNVFIGVFAFGVGVEFINTNLSNAMWDDLRHALIKVAVPALIILSFFPLQDLVHALISGTVSFFGKPTNNKKACRLLLKSTEFSERVEQMKGSSLLTSLGMFSSKSRKDMGITENEFQDDVAFVDAHLVV